MGLIDVPIRLLFSNRVTLLKQHREDVGLRRQCVDVQCDILLVGADSRELH